MSVRIDISGLSQDQVSVVPSPLAELGMALHALAEPGHHPGLQGWITGVSAALDPCLADQLCEAEFLWRTTLSDIFMPYAAQPGRAARPGATLADDLDLLDKLTDEQFVEAALEFTCEPGYYGAPGRPASVLSEPGLRRRALELAAARGPLQVRSTRRLLDDPPAVRSWFRQRMEEAEEAFFGETWARLQHQLAADARHKTELLRHKGLAGALSAVSRAVSLDESGTTITVDKLIVGGTAVSDSGLLLVPTSLGRPHLMVLYRHGWQPVLHYPVASPGLAPPTSVEQLSSRMTALAHPVRMQLCLHLARGPHTTGELTETNGMTAPEISRHLTVLKKAGLVTTRRRGRYVQHQLDLGMVARLGSEFVEGLLR